jgi:hypothetical protein
VPCSKARAELLFEVVSRAYERTSLILTTNLPFEQWTEVLVSERLTGVMLDRLTHRVHILEVNGPSYRLADAKRRHKRRRTPPWPQTEARARRRAKRVDRPETSNLTERKAPHFSTGVYSPVGGQLPEGCGDS